RVVAPDIQRNGVEGEWAGGEEPAADGGEVVDGALADPVLAPEAPAVFGEVETLGRRDVEAARRRPEVVDHPERAGDGAEALAFAHAESGVERADPEAVVEFGEGPRLGAPDRALRRGPLA